MFESFFQDLIKDSRRRELGKDGRTSKLMIFRGRRLTESCRQFATGGGGWEYSQNLNYFETKEVAKG